MPEISIDKIENIRYKNRHGDSYIHNRDFPFLIISYLEEKVILKDEV